MQAPPGAGDPRAAGLAAAPTKDKRGFGSQAAPAALPTTGVFSCSPSPKGHIAARKAEAAMFYSGRGSS